MGTPLPSPEPAAELAPAPIAPVPSGRVCGACGAKAEVSWQRRPTDEELAAHIASVQARHEERLLLADPQQPAPTLPPLPTAQDTTILVSACPDHAIDGRSGLAARIHAKGCTAPNEIGRWGCDCTPEPLPKAAPAPAEDEHRAASRLPAHWAPGAD